MRNRPCETRRGYDPRMGSARQVVLGIDVGGSGIKGAPVDVARGVLVAPRKRVRTPQPATPEAVTRAVARLVRAFRWKGAVGCGVPAVVRDGTLMTAANLDARWIGTDAHALFAKATGCKFTLINDADAAGYAEMTFGAGRGRSGLVILVTIGTGLGTALFINGHLVPNTELGHLEVDGRDAETHASARARKRDALSWKKWAARFDRYLGRLERYFWPDLFILGGGASKKASKYLHHLKRSADVIPAKLKNDAGIVGAALAHQHARARRRRQVALGPATRKKARRAPKKQL